MLPRRVKNLTNKVFDLLTVKRFLEIRNGNAFWLCICNCENIECEFSTTNLNRRNNRSCGCLKYATKNTTHGKSHIPEYRVWDGIRERCGNPKSDSYSRYGGRGIKVCERWQESFENFYADMGPRPGPEYSIERKDNDGDYCPENCKWATRIEQCNNRSNSVILEFNGRLMSISEWSRELKIHDDTIRYRLKKHWSVERALTTPVKGKPCLD